MLLSVANSLALSLVNLLNFPWTRNIFHCNRLRANRALCQLLGVADDYRNRGYVEAIMLSETFESSPRRSREGVAEHEAQ